ncbi:hypothetical protein ACNKHR_03300 [Shigella flexneri]
MSKARGYEVGGTVRIVINTRSVSPPQLGWMLVTPHRTDIGKMVQAPLSTLTRMIRKPLPL